MDNKLIVLLENLDNEIEKKCFELRKKRNQKMLSKVFIVSSLIIIVLPTILAFFQINIISIAVSMLIFGIISLLFLIPFILDNNIGGLYYE